jgi:predicted Zn-dependent protease with MMP-like domain
MDQPTGRRDVGRGLFETLVAEAIDALPPEFRDRLSNVAVVIEDWADHETLHAVGANHPAQVLGFYRGVPQSKRTHSYGLTLPDKIVLYRRPIQLRSRSVEELRQSINHVLRHEIAHHFGIGDTRLRDLEAY